MPWTKQSKQYSISKIMGSIQLTILMVLCIHFLRWVKVDFFQEGYSFISAIFVCAAPSGWVFAPPPPPGISCPKLSSDSRVLSGFYDCFTWQNPMIFSFNIHSQLLPLATIWEIKDTNISKLLMNRPELNVSPFLF